MYTRLTVITVLIINVVSAKIDFEKIVELYNSSIPELNYLNLSADPCNNFYEFSCGNFPKIHPLPEGKKIWDGFQILQDSINQISYDILNDNATNDESEAVQKAQQIYKACMDTDTLQEIDLDPLKTAISELGGWPIISDTANKTFSWDKVADMISEYGISFFIDIQIKPYLFNANETMIYISKDSLPLPNQINNTLDSSYETYLFKIATALKSCSYPVQADLIRRTERRNAFVDICGDIIISETNIPNVALKFRDFCKPDEEIKERVKEIVNFMNAFKSEKTHEDEIPNVYQKITIADFQKWTIDKLGSNYEPMINWLSFLQKIFKNTNITITNSTEVYIPNINQFINIFSLISKQDGEMLNDFLISRLMTFLAPDTNQYMYDIYKEFAKVLPDYNRSDYCTHKIIDYPNIGLSPVVSQVYARKYHSEEIRKKTLEMTTYSIMELNQYLRKNDWMDETTKSHALEKAEKIIVKHAYPDFIVKNEDIDRYYEELNVDQNEHMKNIINLRKFLFNTNLKDLNEPRNRREWTHSPMIVNLFYSTINNAMVFPVSIMNKPFFNGKNTEIDYARLGSVFSQEIFYGFNNNGEMFDADGSFKPWWSKNTTENYKPKAKCFENQYNKYIIPNLNVPVNGLRTLSANIADNIGIKQAYKALQKVKSRMLLLKEPCEIDPGYSDLLFFIGYGTMWCREITLETVLDLHLKNTQAPNQFRVNGPVSNFEKFAETFECPIGSDMNPENKCIM